MLPCAGPMPSTLPACLEQVPGAVSGWVTILGKVKSVLKAAESDESSRSWDLTANLGMDLNWKKNELVKFSRKRVRISDRVQEVKTSIESPTDGVPL